MSALPGPGGIGRDVLKIYGANGGADNGELFAICIGYAVGVVAVGFMAFQYRLTSRMRRTPLPTGAEGAAAGASAGANRLGTMLGVPLQQLGLLRSAEAKQARGRAALPHAHESSEAAGWDLCSAAGAPAAWRGLVMWLTLARCGAASAAPAPRFLVCGLPSAPAMPGG